MAACVKEKEKAANWRPLSFLHKKVKKHNFISNCIHSLNVSYYYDTHVFGETLTYQIVFINGRKYKITISTEKLHNNKNNYAVGSLGFRLPSSWRKLSWINLSHANVKV